MVVILKKPKDLKFRKKGQKDPQKNLFFFQKSAIFNVKTQFSTIRRKRNANSNKLFVGEIRNTARGLLEKLEHSVQSPH